MAYLFGTDRWATDHRATTVAERLGDGRLISSMFDFTLATGRVAMAVVRRPVARGQSNLVAKTAFHRILLFLSVKH